MVEKFNQLTKGQKTGAIIGTIVVLGSAAYATVKGIKSFKTHRAAKKAAAQEAPAAAAPTK